MKHWRINFIFLILFVIGAALISRLFYIQILQHGFYAALAQGQRVFTQELEPKRGEIFMKDKDGNLKALAQNKDLWMIYVVPGEIGDFRQVAESIAPVLGIPESQILDVADSGSSYKIIARRVDENTMSRILKFDFRGIYGSVERSRYYPNDNLASHLIGFLGHRDDGRIGQYGLEGHYNEALSGASGRISGEKDAFGNLIAMTKERLFPARDGDDLILTIDPNIQYQSEKILEEFYEKLDAESGTIIVSDPLSGKIKAMASIPNFNPNQYQDYNLETFLNSAVQKLFEPGSILKPITMAMAIDAGKISPTTTYFDTGQVQIGGSTIKNFDEKSYGEQTMTQVLEKSLNTGAVFVQKQLGNDLFRKYIKDFGLASKTGIDLVGEITGNMNNLYTPYEINFATASFGQGIAVTPIELVVAFSAIASQGEMMRPYIVEKIIKSDGTEIEIKPQPISKVISSRAANEDVAMLISVVDNGFSRKAAVPGYFVAAKTGTAQIPLTDEKGYYTDKTIHSFIGFAPAFEPKFLIFIKMENPKGIKFASDSIAPAFGKLARYLLNYYEIPPER